MNVENFLILGLAYLIGAGFVTRALARTKNDKDPYETTPRNKKIDERTPRGVRVKLIMGRLRGI